ncbi:hypothetical protein OJJOAM_002167 [Cupriavidus sp. H18C1]
MVPATPGWLTTTTCCPISFDSAFASARICTSVAPPGGNGMIIVSVREG